MKRTRLATFVVVAALTAGLVGSAAPAQANPSCTPGFWKNHVEAWPAGVSPDQTVDSVFTGADASLGSQTLLQALSFKGGDDLIGAERVLLRAAVASYLNATRFKNFKPDAATVIADTNAALASGDRDTIIAQAEHWDFLNNKRPCPL